MKNLIILVHSPLVGPFTWAPVAQRLRARGHAVLVPALADRGVTPPPYWQQHAAAVQQSLAMVPQEQPLILVGHSGAGAELPVLAQVSHHPVNGYLFVDAGLPHPGQSRLTAMEATSPAVAQALRQLFAAGERFPNWSDADLLEELPAAAVRRQVLAELQPRAQDFFTEVLPVVDGWPDAPCGYLVFTPGYHHFLENAQQAGWPNRTLASGHFHMLVDPVAVTDALDDLLQQLHTRQAP